MMHSLLNVKLKLVCSQLWHHVVLYPS